MLIPGSYTEKIRKETLVTEGFMTKVVAMVD